MLQNLAEMSNQREAADDSPDDLPSLETLDSPTGLRFITSLLTLLVIESLLPEQF